MTPLNLIGYIGPRYSGISVTTCAVPTQTVSADRSRWAPGVDAGLPGFFDQNGEAQPAVSVLPSERHGIDPDRVRRRIRDALAEEAQVIQNEGAVATSQDIGRCMTLGANIPLGGLSRLA